LTFNRANGIITPINHTENKRRAQRKKAPSVRRGLFDLTDLPRLPTRPAAAAWLVNRALRAFPGGNPKKSMAEPKKPAAEPMAEPKKPVAEPAEVSTNPAKGSRGDCLFRFEIKPS
jgi:hypothetical protein